MFELEDSIAKYRANPFRFALEGVWPVGIVLDKADWIRIQVAHFGCAS
jgi:hypothetical protein